LIQEPHVSIPKAAEQKAFASRARRNLIGDFLVRAARKHRHKIALRFLDREWSFTALDIASARIAHHLAQRGFGKGDCIVAFGKNSDAYYLFWLACTRSGIIHVPANYALKPAELAYVIRQSDACGLVYDAALSETIESLSGEIQEIQTLLFGRAAGEEGSILDAALAEEGVTHFDCPDLQATDICQLLYTSGTTGDPKGAMMTHEALIAEYVACMVECEYAEQDICLAALPFYHSAQMHAFTTPQLLVGATTRILEDPEPGKVLRMIEEEAITSFFAPPTVWINLLRHPDQKGRNLDSLQKLYYGAAIMPEPALRELAERLPQAGLFNCYGQSEIAPVATVLKPAEHVQRPTSAGRPILSVETRVVNESMQDAAPGEQGEIVHRSAQLLVGYWGKPTDTEEAFVGDWFHSGDVGYFDDAGYLYIVDRIKDVINTGGVLVASREIEDVLMRHPAVSEAAVIALPDEKWIEAVSAVIVLRAGAECSREELVVHAAEVLAKFKVPKHVFFTNQLPRNTAGKILKRRLRDQYSKQL